MWLSRSILVCRARLRVSREVNIITGDASQEEAEGVREIRALQRFAEGDPMHPGSTFAGTPVDEAFLLESINGHHLCVVTRVLGATLNVLQHAVFGGRYPEMAARRVMHDVLQALDYCHREGKVIHTGLCTAANFHYLVDPV